MAGYLGQDPAYLAFLRSLGAERDDLQDVAGERKNLVNRELGRRLPEVSMMGDETRRGITGNFLDRGLFRSGQHESALGRQRQAEAQAVSGLEGAAADQNSMTDADLLRQLAGIQRRTADGALTTAGNIGF